MLSPTVEVFDKLVPNLRERFSSNDDGRLDRIRVGAREKTLGNSREPMKCGKTVSQTIAKSPRQGSQEASGKMGFLDKGKGRWTQRMKPTYRSKGGNGAVKILERRSAQTGSSSKEYESGSKSDCGPFLISSNQKGRSRSSGVLRGSESFKKDVRNPDPSGRGFQGSEQGKPRNSQSCGGVQVSSLDTRDLPSIQMVPETQFTNNKGIDIVVDLRNHGSKCSDERMEDSLSKDSVEQKEADRRTVDGQQCHIERDGCEKGNPIMPKKSRDKTTMGSQSHNNSCLFLKDSLVEVTSNLDGFRGAWFIARVVKAPPPNLQRKTTFLVEYLNLLSEDGMKPLRERVSFGLIRPLPPYEMHNDQKFQVNDVVDGYYNDGWVHLDWVDGKWVQHPKRVVQQKEVGTNSRKRKRGECPKSLLRGKKCDGIEGAVDEIIVEDCTTNGLELAIIGEPTEFTDSSSNAEDVEMAIVPSNMVYADEHLSICPPTIGVDSSICDSVRDNSHLSTFANLVFNHSSLTMNSSNENYDRSSKGLTYQAGLALCTTDFAVKQSCADAHLKLSKSQVGYRVS
ncbi:hypothetical protein EZV62_019201 [Acer yangbiense]|uniref:Agenet domain-containing protein n=1 Tax=Acer yangbiense TaxID=1000413 RepID=A0A5C7HBM8_9ROSI|nr:hypothetical protein EZV62_019201 [Acer yangbiense]